MSRTMSADDTVRLAALNPAATSGAEHMDPHTVLAEDALRRVNLRVVRLAFATGAFSLFLLHSALHTFAGFPNPGPDTTIIMVPVGMVIVAPALVQYGPIISCVASLGCTFLGCFCGGIFAISAMQGASLATVHFWLEIARALGGVGAGALYTVVSTESMALIRATDSIASVTATTLTMQALGNFITVAGGQMLATPLGRDGAGLFLLCGGCVLSAALVVARLRTRHPMLAYYRSFDASGSNASVLRTLLPLDPLAWRGALITGIPWLLFDYGFYTINSMLAVAIEAGASGDSGDSGGNAERQNAQLGRSVTFALMFSAFTAAAYAGSTFAVRGVDSLVDCVRVQTRGFLAMAAAFAVAWIIVALEPGDVGVILGLAVPYAVCALVVNVTTFSLATAWSTLVMPPSIPVFGVAAALGKIGAVIGGEALKQAKQGDDVTKWAPANVTALMASFVIVSAASAGINELLWRRIAAGTLGRRILRRIDKRALRRSLSTAQPDSVRPLLLAAAEGGPGGGGLDMLVSQRWWIPSTMLQLEGKLGAGGGGQVFKARLHGMAVAAKEVFEATLSQGAELESLAGELNVLRTLHHPGLVTLYGVCGQEVARGGKTTTRYLIVMELMPLSLRRVLMAALKPDADLARLPAAAVATPARGLRIARQIAGAASFMHAKGWAHCDLKPDNILLSGDGRTVKLCDFGIAQLQARVADGEGGSKVKGTWAYMPPEALLGEDDLDRFAWDVFSLGIILWELFSGKLLYKGHTPEGVARGVVFQGLRPPTGPDAPPGIRNAPPVVVDLMARCWSEDPARRPSMSKCLSVLQEAGEK